MIALLVIGVAVVALFLGRYIEGREVNAALDGMEPVLAKLEAEMRVRVTCSTCRCMTLDRREAARQGWELDPPRCYGCREEGRTP